MKGAQGDVLGRLADARASVENERTVTKSRSSTRVLTALSDFLSSFNTDGSSGFEKLKAFERKVWDALPFKV